LNSNATGGSKRIRLDGGGRRITNPDVELQLANWVRLQRSRKHPVSRRLLRIEAHRVQEDCETKVVITESWIDRFLERHLFSLRRKTTACQKDPQDLIPKIVDFVLYVRKIRKDNEYLLSDIVACDETPVWLDLVSCTTIDMKGAKEIPIKTTGNEKCKMSVMLSAKADGTKLRPHVIINRVRRIDGLSKFKSKLQISYAKKSWFDDELTEEYLRTIIPKGLFQKRRLFVWDSFRCHISQAT